jgi:hypothetical protein
MSIPFLELREAATELEVFINGVRSISLPTASELKAQLLEAIADSPNAELEACIKDLSFAYRVGNASWNGEELIELVLRTREFSEPLSDENHPLVASLIGLIAEVCPDVEKIALGDRVPPCKPKSNSAPKRKENPAASLIELLVSTNRIVDAVAESARWGDIAALKKLLATDPDLVNERTEHGDTPLMLAASGGSLKAARVLLETGADVNARDTQRGWTPLMWLLAALHTEKVYVSVARALIEAGADASIRGIYGRNGTSACETAKVEQAHRIDRVAITVSPNYAPGLSLYKDGIYCLR